jgi:hypothetical protein
MKEAVRQGTTDALMEESEEQGGLDAFGRQTVRVTVAWAFEQAVGSELA